MTLENFRAVNLKVDRANGSFLSDQFAKVGDYNGRRLVVQLSNAGVVGDLTGVDVNLGWQHDSLKNTGLDPFEPVVLSQGIFEIYYPKEMLNEGNVTALIQIIENDHITETKNFKIKVEKSVIDEDTIVSENSFTVLQDALLTVNRYDSRIANVENSKVDKSTFEQSTNNLNAQLQQTENQTKSFVDVTDFYLPSHLGDMTEAFNKAILTGKKILVPSETLNVYGVVDLSKAPMNSYNIEGNAENSRINLIGSGAYFFDKYANQDGRAFHTKNLKNLYFHGDGTGTGLDFRSLQLYAENLTFYGFNEALKITEGYGSKFVNCKFQQNKFDVKFGIHANGIELDNINIDGHEDEGAGIQLDGNTSNLKITGIIESTTAPALWFTENFSGTVDIQLYSELIGDKAKNIPAIRNDSTTMDANVSYTNSKFQVDTYPRESGEFQLGRNPVISKSGVYAPIVGYESLSIQDSYLNSDGMEQLHNPVIFIGVNKIGSSWGKNGNQGIAVQVPMGMETYYDKYTNINDDPFSEVDTNVAAYGSQAPLVEQDTVRTVMGKNTTKVKFLNGVAGSSSTYANTVLPTKAITDIALSPGNLIVVSFMIRANKTAELVYSALGDIQTNLSTFKVDTKWRKYVFVGKNTSETQKYVLPKIHSGTAKMDFEINISGVCVYNDIPNDSVEVNKFLQGKFMY